MYWRTALVILAFLTHAITEMRVTGQTLDVCATCHPNATCEEKVDGTGKACNCMYGFVGNGRTYCQDKNECQIGANKICGQHTACHNTYGSFYCTCLAGYSPSNNMAIFIPNDGTRCQDINECRVQGICGEGGKCTNMQGYFNCLCQVGYQVHNGAEPFHPHQDKALCKAIDCGQPPSALNAVQLSATGTHYGSVAKFGCSEGFFWKSGENSSVCGAESVWKGPSLVCEEITCGDPPILPHTGQVWNGSTNPGSTVLLYCKEGFHREGGGNISYCTENGFWTKTTLSCKEIMCGGPPILPHTGQVWNGSTNPGSTVLFYCKEGFHRERGGDISQCTKDGNWTKATLSCKAIDCGQSPSALNAVQLSATGTHYGSVAKFGCSEGFFWKSGENSSICGAESVWKGPSLVCEATCGPAPALANTEVVLQNTSVVFHRCLEGFHSWRGRNTSVCDITGKWQAATMRCREIKPAISDLVVFNEKCLRWKADKYEEDTENYRVVFVGFRAYQRSFHDKRKKLLSSTSDHPEICLNLLPVTNYTISITALSARFTSTLTTNTSLQVPQAPEILYREIEAPLPTLWLRRSANTLDPISFYQVFVLPLEGTLVFDCSSLNTPDFSSQRKPHGQYITAQLHLRDIGKEINLTLGDGHYYGGFYNAPLQNGRDYYIILRAVSQWGGAFKHSCVIWAKVRDISYIMKVSSLFAGGSIGVFALAIFLGHCYTWFCKKT
ncbi:sushi domain-containing protein 1 isoform X9 [Oncorhynchus kisutch]|uniref:sushi domain-containing protein 1 isoform X9 n=1 Tax=Oncorhynchus kisutch TaxID=8019 RepID=UPI0012DD5CF8|nr:sushi domain-containing protein 1 isoform X9 [Oncorhynchus kisutch]XP_031674562.1 sushi domain-containing protein 1 isoform X9 [Oncorhynchus kisutch]